MAAAAEEGGPPGRGEEPGDRLWGASSEPFARPRAGWDRRLEEQAGSRDSN